MTDKESETMLLKISAWQRETFAKQNAMSVGLEPNYSSGAFTKLIKKELRARRLPRNSDGQGSSYSRSKGPGS